MEGLLSETETLPASSAPEESPIQEEVLESSIKDLLSETSLPPLRRSVSSPSSSKKTLSRDRLKGHPFLGNSFILREELGRQSRLDRPWTGVRKQAFGLIGFLNRQQSPSPAGSDELSTYSTRRT